MNQDLHIFFLLLCNITFLPNLIILSFIIIIILFSIIIIIINIININIFLFTLVICCKRKRQFYATRKENFLIFYLILISWFLNENSFSQLKSRIKHIGIIKIEELEEP